MFTHYKDMKGNAKFRDLGGLGELGVTQGLHSIERMRLHI